MKWLENTIEWLIFQSRWLLAPVYLGLVAALASLSFKFLQELVSYAPTIITSSSDDTILAVLSLVDLVLVGNLIILVIFEVQLDLIELDHPLPHEILMIFLCLVPQLHL